jgi:hypothetical protein
MLTPAGVGGFDARVISYDIDGNFTAHFALISDSSVEFDFVRRLLPSSPSLT